MNVEYSYAKTFQKNWERLTRFDLIRVSKLLEQLQFSAMAFAFGIAVGIPLNDVCSVENDENKSNAELYFEIVLHFCFIILITYYLKKILMLIPFLFRLSPKYVPNLKGEAQHGIGLGLGIVFMSTQTNMRSKITLLKDRYMMQYNKNSI